MRLESHNLMEGASYINRALVSMDSNTWNHLD